LWWNGDIIIIIQTNFVKKMLALVYGNQNLKVKVNVKVKFTVEQATKTQTGSRGITLLFI
jgi:hypothetical protein